jgi:hypothetical protein
MTKGASQAMFDLIAGNVNVGTMTWTSALTQLRAGKVIPIAVSSRARLAEFPDLPTFKELGYDDLTAVSWFALSGPAGLPPDVTQRLNAAVAAMLELPDVKKRLERDAIETRTMSPDEFTRFVASEIDKWGAGRQAGDGRELARRFMPRAAASSQRSARQRRYLGCHPRVSGDPHSRGPGRWHCGSPLSRGRQHPKYSRVRCRAGTYGATAMAG